MNFDQRVHLLVSYDSQNKQRFFPCTASTDGDAMCLLQARNWIFKQYI
jgi:hypothetical protein